MNAATATVPQLIGEARRWLGVPYRHQGRSANGLDCIGFVVFVLARVGVLPDEFESRDYGRLPKAELVEKTAMYCTQVDDAEPGTLLLIRWPGERSAGHAAICAGPTIIHAYSQSRKVVEHGYRAPWPRITVSRWRLPGVVYG